MYPKKLRRDLALIAALSFACLLLNICSCVFLYHKSKSFAESIPVSPNVQAVPLQVYNDSLNFIRLLETAMIPALSCGYLLIGLLVLRHFEKTKNL